MNITLEFQSFVNHGGFKSLTSAHYRMKHSEISFSPVHVWLGESDKIDKMTEGEKHSLAKRKLADLLNN